MKVSCPSCSSVLNIDDKKVPPGGARIKCPSCSNIFPVKAAAPTSSPSGLVPLPGVTAQVPQRQAWEEESTRVAGNVPLPGAAIPGATTLTAPPTNVKLPAGKAGGAVPLPGISSAPAQRQSWEDESTRVGDVPLPGLTAQVPQRQAWEDESTRVGDVPLPGLTAQAPQRQSWEEESTRVAPVAAHAAATAMHSAPSGASRTDTSIPLPGSGAPPPLPPRHAPAEKTSTVPLPAAGATAAIPLPSSPSRAGSAIPLPSSPSRASAGATAAIPLPSSPSRAPAGATAAIPLPSSPSRAGVTAPVPAWDESVPLPGADAATGAVPAWGAIPLPGAEQQTFVGEPGGQGFATESSIPLPGNDAGFDPGASVPLPAGSSDFSFDAAPSQDSGFPIDDDANVFDVNAPAAPGAFDFDAAPPAPAAAPGAFDFDAVPPAPAPGGFSFDPAPAEAPASDFGFDPAPPPPAAAPGGFSFDPAPAAAPGGFSFDPAPAAEPSGFSFDPAPAPAPAANGFSFDPAPAPAAEAFSFDASAPPAPASSGFSFDAPAPAPAAPPLTYGEVDFGGGGGGGDLEFDPTAAPGASGGADDLEADLSAPMPQAAPQGPADGLEMLSFIDRSAQEAGAKPDERISVRRFHVKRRSGKVFGPFEEAVVVKMLEDGQLLGNEEVSLDGESWTPIGAEAAFQPVIARLMEAPSRSSTQQGMPQVEEQKGPSMDRLKQLYEGRMAAVAVVQSKEPVPFKKRIPYIAAGVLAAAFIAGGVVLGTATPYGFFALKLLFPAKVRPDTREFGYLQAARQDFMADTWKSYRDAKEQANQALAIKEFPEARAVWAQAVFYLQRRFKKADPAEVDRAHAELVNIKLLGDKHPETLKTEASAALTDGKPDEALTALSELLARNGDDLEGLFLRAEAYQLKKQPQQARSEYEAILKKDPKSARAQHALGLLNRTQNQTDDAAKAFEAALELEPMHLSSAVELAEIDIIVRKDLKAGAALLDRALSDEGKVVLAPSLVGKALALRAESLVIEGKLADSVPVFEDALKADPKNPFTTGHLAHAYAALNQPEKAIPLYQIAAGAQPDRLEYTEGYLSALILVGKMDEATQVMNKARTLFPDNAMLSYLSARVADKLDSGREAEEAYKRAIAADPTIIDAYLYLSRYYMRFRRFSDAAPVLEEGLKQAPDNAALRVGMGELALHERDVERANKEFARALELDDYLADAHLGASRAALEAGDLERANKESDRALELNPRLPGGKLQHGVVLWKLGRLDEAIAELDAAHEADPRDIQVIVTQGAVKFDKGDLDGALAHLSSALVAQPSHADANFYLARVKTTKSEHTQAIEAIKRALDQEPKNPRYLYWYGRVLTAARKIDDAVAEYKLALEIDPRYADVHEALGKIAYDRNDFNGAVASYRQVLTADPSRTSVYALIGDAQMKMEDWNGAVASYEKALEADHTLKQVFPRLGEAYQEKNNLPRAIEWYRKAVEAKPDDADSWLRLGYLFKDSNRKQDAKTAFNQYLELRPDAKDAREVRDQIVYLDQK